MARYHSFAPERTDINAKWYIDGEDYFSDLADAIEDATAEIFITDWSMNPVRFLAVVDPCIVIAVVMCH